MYDEIFSREVSRAQSKYEIVEKHVTQQSSYNLDLKLMYRLLEENVIKFTYDNHYEINDDYKLLLGDGILSLIGNEGVESDFGVNFIYTKANDGTEKFQIKRKENSSGKYQWFQKLYDKNCEGSKFKIYLDKENKIIKFDNFFPVNVNSYDYELVDDNSSLGDEKYLAKKLRDYYDSSFPKLTGIYLFGIDFCECFNDNENLEKRLIEMSGLKEEYIANLQNGIYVGRELRSRKKVESKSVTNIFTDKHLEGFNKIYYGIPGCGKSYKVSSMLKYKEGFREEASKNGINGKVSNENIIRTTFFLDYSNSDFVGQIYPVVDDNGNVTYESIPGPFTKALVRAYMNPNEMVYLVIEEINRGNAAAIFGDLFQLLDRVKETKDGKIKGESEYPISNEFIEGYLKKIVKGSIEGLVGDTSRLLELSNHNIIIPNNLTIFATMNTSDQNVFPLDTAFKRRWNLERVKVDWSKEGNKYKLPILNKCIPFTDMTWGNFASNVNIKMVEDCKDGIITQDKNLGPFFIDEELLVDAKDRYNPENKDKLIQFTNNVIDYLFLDVTKFDHDVLFEGKIKYSDVYDYFTESLHNVVASSQDAKRYLKIFANKISDDVIDDLSRGNGNNLGESDYEDSEKR